MEFGLYFTRERINMKIGRYLAKLVAGE